MVKTVIGSFDRVDDADRAIRALRGAGFLDSDINLVANDVRRGDTTEPTVRNVAGETTSGAATGAVAGGALGGAAGLAASLMGLAIPGIGPILAAGPIVAALAGAGAGAVAGGLIGSLTELGVYGIARNLAETISQLVTRASGFVLYPTVAAAGRRNRWLNVSIYGVLLVVVGALVALIPSEASIQAGTVSLPAWSGETPIRLVAKWSIFNLAPTLLTVTFRNRHVRAVAPLVLSFMTVVSAGVLGIIAAAFLYEDLSATLVDWAAGTLGVSAFAALVGYLLLLCAIACLLFGLVGWRLLVWMRSGYQRKTISDQSLAIDAIWLLFASFYAVILALAGPGWALSALVAFVVLKTAVRTGDAWLRSVGGSRQRGPTLLVLRVFALGASFRFRDRPTPTTHGG